MFIATPDGQTERPLSPSGSSLPEETHACWTKGREPQSIREEIQQLWVFPVFIASVAALALSYEEVTRTVLYLTEKGSTRNGNRGLLKLGAIMVRTKEEQVLPPATVSAP